MMLLQAVSRSQTHALRNQEQRKDPAGVATQCTQPPHRRRDRLWPSFSGVLRLGQPQARHARVASRAVARAKSGRLAPAGALRAAVGSLATSSPLRSPPCPHTRVHAARKLQCGPAVLCCCCDSGAGRRLLLALLDPPMQGLSDPPVRLSVPPSLSLRIVCQSVCAPIH